MDRERVVASIVALLFLFIAIHKAQRFRFLTLYLVFALLATRIKRLHERRRRRGALLSNMEASGIGYIRDRKDDLNRNNFGPVVALMVSFLFLLLGISHSTSVTNKVLIDLMKMNEEFIIHVSLQFKTACCICVAYSTNYTMTMNTTLLEALVNTCCLQYYKTC